MVLQIQNVAAIAVFVMIFIVGITFAITVVVIVIPEGFDMQ